jgi:pSer/pThr/pTyr-binding forkhead associated (FHA) protein
MWLVLPKHLEKSRELGLPGNSLPLHDLPAKEDRTTLTIQGGPNSGYAVRMTSAYTTLGRHADNDVVFDEALASRRHAAIVETESGFLIRDLDSTNGTYLNDRPVSADDMTLKNGDVISLGRGSVSAVFTMSAGATVRRSSSVPDSEAFELVVDTRARQVYVRGERLEPPLTRKQFDLLMLLDSRRGEAVSRDEIAETVWPERAEGDVGNHEIEQSVRRVRVRIEADPSNPRYLVTVRGFGYSLT